jgi:hypothetical protein
MGTIIQHLEAIEHLELVLPEFQREYVWGLEQAKQLMVSLYRGYPTGSLLFWETANPPAIKNNALPKNYVGRVRVLLDGQQRLTTLYLFIKGEIPPYYTSEDLMHDPRDLYFHLVDRDFEYYGPIKMGKDPFWIRVVDFFEGVRPNIFALAQAQTQLRGGDPMELAEQLNASMNLLEGIKQQDYPVQTVPSDADIDDAIDVFDRVNSLGTRLTEAELALAHMAGRWPEIRRIFKQKLEKLGQQSFHFSLDFLVRCMTGIVTDGALYERIHKASKDHLKSAWQTLDHVLDTVVALLRGRAFVHGSEDLSTANVLVPIVVYLARHGGSFQDDHQIRRFLYWMYQALLWSRYSAQADQRLEKDVKHVLESTDPVEALLNEILDGRDRLDVRATDLEGRGIDNPIFRIMHIVAKSQGAVDWFTGMPLAGNSSLAKGETYYIFPPSVLYSTRYSSENHIHKKMVNEIANRIVVERLRSSDETPDKVLPQVVSRFPNALAQQFVPSDPSLWDLDNFEKFLELRREMIANGINGYLASLIEERIPERVFPQIPKLLDMAIASQARRAVEKLTVSDVDEGLRSLAKLFETTLKNFIHAADASGTYTVPASTYDSLMSMINWTKAQGIITDPTALNFLRLARNTLTHDDLAVEERLILFNNAGWMAGMYLDYILLFSAKEHALQTRFSLTPNP